MKSAPRLARSSRVIGMMLTFFLVTGPLYAQPAGDTALFIASTPYGAEVRVDGEGFGSEGREGVTPFLLRGLSPGAYQISVSHDGYQKREAEVTVGSNPYESVDLTLSPHLIAFIPPPGHSVFHPGVAAPADGPIVLPTGDYRIDQADAVLNIEPLYPRQSYIDGLQFAVPLFMLVAAALAVSDSVNPRPAELPLSVETITATSVAVGLLVSDIALHADRRAFRKRAIPQTPPLTRLPNSDQSLLEFAHVAEANGDLGLAAAIHQRIATEHPYSRRVPQSLYRAARIELSRGRYAEAEALLLELVTRYPTPDTYDLSLRNLADLYEISGRNEEAINQIDQMVFADSSVPKELMMQRRDELSATNQR